MRGGGGQRFTIAGGWYWSTLEKPQYEPVQGFPLDRDGNVIIPEALGPTVGDFHPGDVSAADGPAYYFERRSGKVLGYCGGYCMMGGEKCARTCPPPEWTCQH